MEMATIDEGLATPCNASLQLPSPIITRRTRTRSTCARAMENPIEHGTIREFNRSKGHGFVTPKTEGLPDLFVHISDIEGEYIPQHGDEVSYRLCLIPPKMEKYQAINVKITNFAPERHQKWEYPIHEDSNHAK